MMFMYDDNEELCAHITKVDATSFPPIEFHCGQPVVDGTEHCDEHQEGCSWQTGGTYETPPEHCDADVEAGEELCSIHRRMSDELDELSRKADELMEAHAASDEEC